jgi:transcriptional regulator with XRE-family HTH domain
MPSKKTIQDGAVDPTISDSDSDTYEEKIRKQVLAVSRLEERGLTRKQIGRLCGRSTLNVRHWAEGEYLAHPKAYKALLTAANSSNSYLPNLGGGPGHLIQGAWSAEQIERRDRLLALAGMETPRQRAEKLRWMMKKLGLTRSEFADLIGIGESTVYQYLNPKVDLAISLPIVQRIYEIQADLAKRKTAPATIEERFEKAWRDLLGPELARKGFGARDHRRMKLAEILAGATGASSRKWYRYIPPSEYQSSKKPSAALVAELESVYREFGRVKLPSNASAASRKKGSSKKKARGTHARAAQKGG